jgi:hypothetical protein
MRTVDPDLMGGGEEGERERERDFGSIIKKVK